MKIVRNIDILWRHIRKLEILQGVATKKLRKIKKKIFFWEI